MVCWFMEYHYFLDWNACVLLVSSELLAGVVFEGALYSRARSIPFSLSLGRELAELDEGRSQEAMDNFFA